MGQMGGAEGTPGGGADAPVDLGGDDDDDGDDDDLPDLEEVN